LLNGKNWLKVYVGWMSNTGWAFLQHFLPEAMRKLSYCGDCARGFILLSVHIGGTDAVSSFPTLKLPLPNDCVCSWACSTAILTIRQLFSYYYYYYYIILLYNMSTATAIRRHNVNVTT
jgi:hypothetical protein